MNNMKSYLYIAKMRFISTLAYKFDVVVTMLGNILVMLTTIFIWHTVYSGKGSVAGVNESQMVTYAILAALLNTLQDTQVQNTIVQKVVTGEIAIDFLRPVNLLLSWMSDDIGSNISWFFLNLVPVVLLSALFFKPVLAVSGLALFLLPAAVVLSFLLVWLMFCIVGMLAFWFMELGNLGIVQGQLIRLLSGVFIPLWFFPDWVQTVSRYLPFQYMSQFPLSICIGKVGTEGAIKGVVIQFIWVVFLGIVLHLIWERAQKHVLVQGG